MGADFDWTDGSLVDADMMNTDVEARIAALEAAGAGVVKPLFRAHHSATQTGIPGATWWGPVMNTVEVDSVSGANSITNPSTPANTTWMTYKVQRRGVYWINGHIAFNQISCRCYLRIVKLPVNDIGTVYPYYGRVTAYSTQTATEHQIQGMYGCNVGDLLAVQGYFDKAGSGFSFNAGAVNYETSMSIEYLTDWT